MLEQLANVMAWKRTSHYSYFYNDVFVFSSLIWHVVFTFYQSNPRYFSSFFIVNNKEIVSAIKEENQTGFFNLNLLVKVTVTLNVRDILYEPVVLLGFHCKTVH